MIVVAPATDGGVDLEELRTSDAGRDRAVRTVFHFINLIWRAELREACADSRPASLSSALDSWFPAEGDVVVEIDEIKPGLHVFAVLGELADVLGEILERLDITTRAAASHERAPGVDFPRSALRF